MQLKESYMRTTATYSTNGKSISAELFTPSTAHDGRLIVLAHGSDGLVDSSNGPWKSFIEGYATDLAEMGIVTVIPDYFAASATVAGDLDPTDPISYVKQIAANRSTWVTALKDATHELSKPSIVPGIDPSRIGLLGFSLGGHLCARLAGDAKAAVLFFPPYMIDGLGKLGSLSTFVEIHHGARDFLPYSQNAEVIHTKLSGAGAQSTLWPAYPGAVHGFVGHDADNTSARNLSRARTLAFFDLRL